MPSLPLPSVPACAARERSSTVSPPQRIPILDYKLAQINKLVGTNGPMTHKLLQLIGEFAMEVCNSSFDDTETRRQAAVETAPISA